MKKQAGHAKVITKSWPAFSDESKAMNKRTKHIKRAFTLVEILIVVTILGILAAVVMPMASGGAISAKQSALSVDLQLLNRFIVIYKTHHLEVAPGYPGGNTSAAPTETAFVDQATLSSNTSGQTAAVGTAGYIRGPYMQHVPTNPLNGLNTIQMLGNGEAFPANGDNSHGWVYKAATGEIRADSTGTDDSGKLYYEY